VEERIRLHLFDHQRFHDEFVSPPEITQDGIAEATGVLRPNVSRAFRDLMNRGMVEERLSHVSGQDRRKKVYFLSGEGLRSTHSLRSGLLALPVRIPKSGGEAEETTLGKVMERSPGSTLLEAYDRLDEMGTVLGKGSPPSAAAMLYDRVSRRFWDMGPSKVAVAFHESSKETFAEQDDPLMAAKAANNLGVLHRMLGRPARAREAYNDALTLLEGVGDPRGAALVRYNLGRLEEERGNRRKALEFYKRSVRDLKNWGKKGEVSMVEESRKRLSGKR